MKLAPRTEKRVERGLEVAALLGTLAVMAYFAVTDFARTWPLTLMLAAVGVVAFTAGPQELKRWQKVLLFVAVIGLLWMLRDAPGRDD